MMDSVLYLLGANLTVTILTTVVQAILLLMVTRKIFSKCCKSCIDCYEKNRKRKKRQHL